MGRAASVAVVGLFVLACVYTLYLGRELLMPMATAFVLFVILSPFVRRASRSKIPRGVSAALLVLGLFVIFALGVYALSDPISEWRQRAPELLSQVEFKLRGLKESVKEVQEASKEVEKIAEQVSGGDERTQKVVVESPSLIQRFLGGLQSFGVQLAIIFVLLYFMLASGGFFLEAMIKALPIQSDRKCALTIARQVEQQVSGYIVTVSIINAGLGLSLCIAFYLIELPNALLWGAMAGLLNFVPFIGAAVGAFVVGVVSLVSFDSLAYAAAAPAAYVGLNFLEANFVTPSILGRRFTIHPVIVFVAVIVWSWLWGVPGGLLAVPFLVILKALCDYIAPWNTFGTLLRGRG